MLANVLGLAVLAGFVLMVIQVTTELNPEDRYHTVQEIEDDLYFETPDLDSFLADKEQ